MKGESCRKSGRDVVKLRLKEKSSGRLGEAKLRLDLKLTIQDQGKGRRWVGGELERRDGGLYGASVSLRVLEY